MFSAATTAGFRPAMSGWARMGLRWVRLARMLLPGLTGLDAIALPNLAPFHPAGWSGPLMVATTPGLRVDSARVTGVDEIFVSFVVGNVGSSTSLGHHVSHLYVDGVLAGIWASDAPVSPGFQFYVTDYSIGWLAPGTHFLRVWIDPSRLIAESNENDNVFDRAFEVVGKPNLLPQAGPGMSDVLVVSTTPGTTTDAARIGSTDTLFVDFEVANAGEADTDAPFYVDLYLDGELWSYWSIDEVLPVGVVYHVSDEVVVPLPAGEHELMVLVDSEDEILESDEGDNRFTKRFFVRGAPNLVPDAPPDWPGPLVVSSVAGTRADSPRLGAGEVLYLDWAVGSIGGAGDVTNSFLVEVFVDDVLQGTWTLSPPLALGDHAWREDVPIGPFEAGAHTIRLRADGGNSVRETNEGDNDIVKTITVGNHPNLAPTTPAGWSDSIVVSHRFGTLTDSGLLLSTDKLYVDVAVGHRGRGGITAPWELRLLLDGALKRTWTVPAPLAAGGIHTVLDFSLGSLAAGSHALELVADPTDAIPESNDADNSYRKTFEVIADDPFGIPDIHVEPASIGWTLGTVGATVPLAPAAPLSAPETRAGPAGGAVGAEEEEQVRPAGVRKVDRTLRGMPASPEAFEETQPDGTTIRLRQRGGVRRHWLEDDDGFTVLKRGDAFVYAARELTGGLGATLLRVGRDDPAAAGLRPHEKPPITSMASGRTMALQGLAASPAPAALTAPTGTVENVVILVRFSNHESRALPAPSDYHRIFNAAGGDPVVAPTGSVRDFYHENSYGTMILRSTVFGWVTLPRTESYYANGESGLGLRVGDAIRDALVAADPLIDFSRFDANHDGFVDTITFIHSGYGAEAGGTSSDGAISRDRIWSHRFHIPTWTSAEGVRVSDYHIDPGLWGITGSGPTRIGVVCHELGHVFGLPDLYDMDGGGEGAGSFELMANSWGFGGDQRNPPHFGAWSKIFLGWVKPTTIPGPGVYVAPQSETSPTVFRLDLGYPSGEYLLIENREPVGFESTLPQGGLAIWHVDESKGDNDDEGYPGQWGWPENDSHYRVALLQADGRFDLERYDGNRGDALDLFHGGGVHELGVTTVPNTDSYRDGTISITGNRIHEIGPAGTNISFRVSVEPPTNRFRIGNSGDGVLRVETISPQGGVAWISLSPTPPYGIKPGEAVWVTVSADAAAVPMGTNVVRLLVTSNDPFESQFADGIFVRVVRAPPAPGRITGRYVFYNQSAWDGGDPVADARDDAAIATDKTALLPGGTARFSNYTSYSRGLNGIMVDVAGLRGTPTVSDFELSMGNSNDPLAWNAAPAPGGIGVRVGAGTGGGDRITLTWGADAVKGRWLRVRVRATAVTGLAADDVFHFGNAVGEVGNQPDVNAIVNATDELLARVNPRSVFNPAPIDSPHDFNRDKQVNATDQIVARLNTTSAFTALRLIMPEPAGSTSHPSSPASSPALSSAEPETAGARLIVRRREDGRLLIRGVVPGAGETGAGRFWQLESFVEGEGWMPASEEVEGDVDATAWRVDPASWEGARWFRLRHVD